jgi:hypothetical protein
MVFHDGEGMALMWEHCWYRDRNTVRVHLHNVVYSMALDFATVIASSLEIVARL